MKGKKLYWAAAAVLILAVLLIFAARRRAAAPAGTASAIPSRPGLHKLSGEFNGKTRSFTLYIPKSYDTNRPAALVVNLHGAGGDAESQINSSQMNLIADKAGFVVAYPEALGGNWNDSRSYAAQKSGGADDLGFIKGLAKQIEAALDIDKTRVYATGISNGGMMAYRLACQASDVFAAAAPVAAGMPESLKALCQGGRPVSVIAMQGTGDKIIPYAGGRIRATQDFVLSAKDSINFWLNKDDCAKTAQITKYPDKDPADGTTAESAAYECAGGRAVELVTIAGGGHTWPGGKRNLPEILVGKISRDINGSQIIWDFFSARRLAE